MDKNALLHLGVFILILVALNFFFGDYGLHISIIGSLILTVVLSFVMQMFQPKQ